MKLVPRCEPKKPAGETDPQAIWELAWESVWIDWFNLKFWIAIAILEFMLMPLKREEPFTWSICWTFNDIPILHTPE